MADFLRNLPAPQVIDSRPLDISLGASAALESLSDHRISVSGSTSLVKSVHIPPYGKRGRWAPQKQSDFNDGGAFPEIHIPQFPLNLGSKNNQIVGKTVALQAGPSGKLEYDAILRVNSDKAVVYSKPEDQKTAAYSLDVLRKPTEEEALEAAEQTAAVLQAALNGKLAAQQVQISERKEPEFLKYTPNKQAAGHNDNCKQRVIRMVEKQTDPLEPAKFRHKRAPAGPPSPPPPVQHSPPRKLTVKDQQEWKIPPSVSNWKNQKGYTIPLDKRIQADGRGLHDVSINDKFASLSEALYIAERSAREEIRIRNEMLKQKKAKEEETREQQLRELASKARAERSNLMRQKVVGEDSSGRQQREQIERERNRELERDMRLQRSGKRGKIVRDSDRDISERIALGQPQPTSQEALYDARLFNQTAGMDSGFDGGNDESYTIYDKPLFADRAAAGIYQHSRDRFQQNVGADYDLPSFAGANKSKGEQRTAPVEFEKDTSDPFGLDNLLTEARKTTDQK